MIKGTQGGSGKYSYHARYGGRDHVRVIHMPEDDCTVRIVFDHNGESREVLSISDSCAEMLYFALGDMAKDMKWKDYGQELEKDRG